MDKKNRIHYPKHHQKREIVNNQIIEQYKYQGSYDVETLFILITYDQVTFSEKRSSQITELLPHIDLNKNNWLVVKGLNNVNDIVKAGTYFGLNPLEIQDIFNPYQPPKVDAFQDYLLVIANEFFIHEGELSRDFISICMKNNLLISFQETETAFFANIKDAIHNNKAQIREKKIDILLSVLLNNIVASYNECLRQLEERLVDLEGALMEEEEVKDIRIKMQKGRKEYTSIKQSAISLNEEYSQLLYPGNKLIDKMSFRAFNDVQDHLRYTLQLLEACRENLSTLADMYIANNDLRMNSIMQRLTVVGTIFLPLTFLAGVWGMNFQNMPELNWKYGYLLAWGIMIVSGLFLWWFFVKRKWF